jgi:hypothetical protein
MTQSPVPGSPARTATTSRPPPACTPAPDGDRRTPPQRRHTPPDTRSGRQLRRHRVTLQRNEPVVSST